MDNQETEAQGIRARYLLLQLEMFPTGARPPDFINEENLEQYATQAVAGLHWRDLCAVINLCGALRAAPIGVLLDALIARKEAKQ